MSDSRPRLYTCAEVAAELIMSERQLSDFLTKLGFAKGTRGVRRVFTPADLDYLTEQRSWLLQSARGAKSGTRAVASVSASKSSPSGSSAQDATRETMRKLLRKGKPSGSGAKSSKAPKAERAPLP